MVLLGVFMQLGDGVAPMAHMRRRWTHWSYHLGHPGSPQAQSMKRHFTLAHTLAQVDRHFGPWQLATGFHRRWFTEAGRSPLDLESLWYSLSGDSVKGMTWMEWSLHLHESKFVMVPDCHRAGVLCLLWSPTHEGSLFVCEYSQAGAFCSIYSEGWAGQHTTESSFSKISKKW